jgi:hypothetical protein
MSGTYPTTPEFQAINVVSKHKNLMSEAISGRVQVRAIGGQKWQFTAKYNPMTRVEFMPVYSFVTAQQGMLGTFTIVPPVISSTSGTASGTALVNGNHAIGDRTITVDGFTGSLKAGDFVKFANHSKVYMLTADRSGAGTMTIEPALVATLANDEVITYNSVPFTMRLSNDIQEYSLSANEYYTYEIDMAEAL